MRRLVTMCLLAGVPLGCGGSALTPTAPSPTPLQAVTGPFSSGSTSGPNTVGGVITEITPQGSRPLGGVSVSAWVDLGRSGYSYMWANGARATDPNGRYQLANLPEGASVTLQVWKEGYVQQCAAPTFKTAGDTMIDLRVVSKALVSADPASVSPPAAGYRNISGVVYETSSDGRRPLAGAFIDFEPVMDFPAALTLTDPQGRYLLCGIPEGTPVELGASVNINRVAYVTVAPFQTTGADIEIPGAR
jgi:hypothetical protein